MSSLNKAIILGRLVQDPSLKTTQSGLSILNMQLATSKMVKEQQKTQWHRIVAFDKIAINCKKYLFKGSLALVEGELQTSSYEKDGVKHYSTEIVAHSVQFVGSAKPPSSQEDRPSSQATFPEKTEDPPQEPLDPTLYDSIPF